DWRYKEGGKGEWGYEEKMGWLREVLEWGEKMGERGKEEVGAGLKTEVLKIEDDVVEGIKKIWKGLVMKY
ncbi:hypothetical protein, partial [Neisseria sicca]|uniref:hypothetical protein n=1 Tax=Neisseria sicca TaxID=490 RepID=UPI001649D7C9